MKRCLLLSIVTALLVTTIAAYSLAEIDQRDFDGDGDIDGYDLSVFAEKFGAVIWYKDFDGDGHSDGATEYSVTRPTYYYPESELTATSGDCDDEDENVNPGMDEICDDGLDNDCDNQVDCGDDECSTAAGCTCVDNDGDGYGEGQLCLGPDCYDENANAFPGQTESFSVDRGDGSFDYDCDGAEEKIGGAMGPADCPYEDTIVCDDPPTGAFLCPVYPPMILYQGECGDEIEVGECNPIGIPCVTAMDCVLDMGTSGQIQSCR